jgi:hypothetical protein
MLTLNFQVTSTALDSPSSMSSVHWLLSVSLLSQCIKLCNKRVTHLESSSYGAFHLAVHFQDLDIATAFGWGTFKSSTRYLDLTFLLAFAISLYAIRQRSQLLALAGDRVSLSKA